MNKLTISFVTIVVIILGYVLLQTKTPSELDTINIVQDKTAFYELKTASGTVHVAGVVTSADSAVVSAKTNGVLQSLLVTEGTIVSDNQKVAIQDTPVANAQLAYKSALENQMIAEQLAMVDNRIYTAEKASVTARTTEEIALITTEAVKTQLQAETGSVRTAIESSLTTMLDTLSFVHENPELFSDSRRKQFSEIVNDLYGSIPNHFSSGINYGEDITTTDTREVLEQMRDFDIDSLSVIDTENLGVIVMGQLRALVTLYTTAEEDVLDRDKIVQGGGEYTTYFTNRANILGSLSALEIAQKTLQSKIDILSQTSVANKQSVSITDIDKTLAERQANFSEGIALAAEKAARAATNLATAEVSLGTVYAPFSGVVSTVFVETGEYIAAGQPLFTLHGNKARELIVSVPVNVGTQLKTGTSFYTDGEISGTVDRFNPVQQGHSIEVFISLSDTSLPVGSSLQGELSFDTTDGIFLVPREYVFFNSDGPYVQTETGERYLLQIVLDNGATLLISFVEDIPKELLIPNRSITF